jgi:hypothetical protein
MNYVCVNAEGLIESWGSCLGADVPASQPGMTVLREATPPADRSRRWRWDGQTFVDTGPRFPTTYASERQEAYPPATEQLDMLWHAMDSGATPKIEPWFSTIKAIKDAHPKP